MAAATSKNILNSTTFPFTGKAILIKLPLYIFVKLKSFFDIFIFNREQWDLGSVSLQEAELINRAFKQFGWCTPQLKLYYLYLVI